jgi:CO/xanthine dehydrogenase Mo-binding subunit
MKSLGEVGDVAADAAAGDAMFHATGVRSAICPSGWKI